MNIVFMGTPEFAVPALRGIHNSGHKLLSVVTAPDKPKGRGLKLSESAVKQYAMQNRLNVLQPAKLNDPGFVKALQNLNPDLIVVVAFRILPPEVFNLPKYGSINLHASLLPKYRGAAPINWAIISGENQTGVTTFFLKDKVDTGNIILQQKVEITDHDNAGTLHDKLMSVGAEVVLDTIKIIEEDKNKVPLTEQNESIATPAPKIFKEDCRINWNSPAQKIHNLVRGLSPHPGSFTSLNGKQFKIYKTSLTDLAASEDSGEIIIKENEMYVSCADFLLKIEEIQPEGKRRMSAKEFLAGHKLVKGDKFMYLQG
ncbi:MAG TPA: methionyl-tRNA formyltransferase [Ignavibacteria bacterium]|jgi:methionyl-tRNA formyltransferase